MKKVITVLSVTLIAMASQAQKVQEKAVPAVVKTAFQKTFPDAQHIKWEKENNAFEVGFSLNNNSQSALFDSNGHLLESEVTVAINQLPEKAATYIAQHYKGQKIKEVAKITDAKGVTTFEAEVKGKDLIFDTDGNFIKAINQ